MSNPRPSEVDAEKAAEAAGEPASATSPAPRETREIGGRADGTDPTRYGDWEKNGRCIDF